MPERSNGAVSKTVEPLWVPGVRIPLSPPVSLREIPSAFGTQPDPVWCAIRNLYITICQVFSYITTFAKTYCAPSPIWEKLRTKPDPGKIEMK